ncbi:hypothetical protein, partial [Pseudochrobactrum kiredjianiae]
YDCTVPWAINAEKPCYQGRSTYATQAIQTPTSCSGVMPIIVTISPPDFSLAYELEQMVGLV